jgi:hypothetical protein
MQKVEFKNRLDLEIYCPFCGVKVLATNGMEKCEHVIFHANDYGFEYIREDFAVDADVDLDDMSVDEYTDSFEMSNAIKFAIYSPAPESFGGYIGFGLNPLSEVDMFEQNQNHQTPPGKLNPQTLSDETREPAIPASQAGFQVLLKSIVELPPAKYIKAIIDSPSHNERIIIPQDILDAKVVKILCFTRNGELPLAKPLTRVINRFDTFRELENLPIDDFLDTEGIGKIAAKAFFVWYSKLHLGTYEELIKEISTKTQNPPSVSAYLQTKFNEMGLTELAQLYSLPDSSLSPLAALEIRTLEYFDSQNNIGSAANIFRDENFLQRVYQFNRHELTGREREVVELRYSTADSTQSTLQNIGLKLGLTRERVRQILEKVHKTFKEKFIISSEHFYEQMRSKIMTSQSPIQASDFVKTTRDTDEAAIAMSFIADVFPKIPIQGHLQSPDTKALIKYSSNLKILMESVNAMGLQVFVNEDDPVTEVLVKLYSIFASSNYDLVEGDNYLKIIKSELSLMEAVLECVTSFERPASIDEIAIALDNLDRFKGSYKDSYFNQKKQRGIGATSLFVALQRNEQLVRIERYQWGLTQHVAYQEQWDEVARVAAGIIGESDVQFSAASLIEKLQDHFPQVRSRYELDYILKGSKKLNYLGYQTYSSLSADNTVRITVRELINEILTQQNRPMLIQDLLEKIGSIRTMDYRGIFSALSQYPEVINYSNQFVTLKKNKIEDLKFINRQPVFIARHLDQIFPYTEWKQFAQSIDGIEEVEGYLKYVVSLDNVQIHKTETSLWLVPKDSYLLRKAVTIVCAEQSAISLDDIVSHLEDSFGERGIDRGSLKHRLGKNIYIKTRADGLFSFQDPELLRIQYADLLDKLESILFDENGSLELQTLIKKLSHPDLNESSPENAISIIKADDRFTVLTDNLIGLS